MADSNPTEKIIKDTIAAVQGQINAMLNQVTEAMNGFKKSAMENSSQIKDQYTKGASDLKGQLTKANSDLIAQYTKNYNELTNALKENYNNMYAQAKTNIDKTMTTLKGATPDAIQNFPAPQKKMYDDAMKAMQDKGQATLNGLNNAYKDLQASMDKNYKEGLEAIKQAQANAGSGSSGKK